MKKIILATFCFSLAACTAAIEKQMPNAVVVNSSNATVENVKTPENSKPEASKYVGFSVGKAEVKTGGAGEAEINLKIQEPFHINSNPPSEKSFIPLEVEFLSADGVTAGKPIYPKGEQKRFQFSDKPLSVYAGEIVIKLPLKIDKTVVAGQKELHGKLKFQPCDEEVCYRPQTVEVTLPVTIN